jgi:hypothetical protein
MATGNRKSQAKRRVQKPDAVSKKGKNANGSQTKQKPSAHFWYYGMLPVKGLNWPLRWSAVAGCLKRQQFIEFPESAERKLH